MNDEVFSRKQNIPMTKEEIRYIALGYLDIVSGKKLLDIGSGTGSISLEAAHLNLSMKIKAIETSEEAFKLSLLNLEGLDCQKKKLKERVEFINDKAPSSRITETFDRIFIGGTKGDPSSVIKWAYELMDQNGVLVMNFITIENFTKSMEYIKNHDGFEKPEGSLVNINKLTDIGPYTYLKPNNPTFIIKTTKK